MTNKKIEEKPKKNGRYRPFLDFSVLENDKYIQKWLENIKSKRERIGVMQKFLIFLDNKTPKELALEHQKDLRIEDLTERSDIAKKQLNAFFSYLTDNIDEKWINTLNDKIIEKPISWNSARQYVFSKLISFYSRIGIPIHYAKTDTPSVSNKVVKEKTWKQKENGKWKIISISEAKPILKQIRDSFNSLRDRAIYLSKLSSALDDVDLFNLTISQFNNGYNPELRICYLQGDRQKDKMLFQTFLGSEACNMIQMYLKDRKDKIKALGIPENNYLFRINKQKENEKVDTRYFSEKMREVILKLELANITPKSLRRWFNTHLEKNAVMDSIIGRFMGHAGNIRDKHYSQMFLQAKEGYTEELSTYFIENIEPLISLGNGSQHITKIDKKVEKLEVRIGELHKTNEKLFNIIKSLGKFIGDDYIMYRDQNDEDPELKNRFGQIRAIMDDIDKLEITDFSYSDNDNQEQE